MSEPPTSSSVVDASDVIDSLALGFASLDRNWRITRVNAVAEQVMGRPAAQLVGRDVWETFPGARELEFGRALESVMSTGQPAAFDAWYPGLRVWVEVRVQPTAGGLACYFLDITARKQMEAQRAETAERARLVALVADTLASSLEVGANVARLARVVLPYLGSWSIVTVAQDDGTMVDTASWHVDPARRPVTARYAALRQTAMAGTLAQQAMDEGKPVALMTDAHAQLHERMAPSAARDVLDELAPVAAAVLPMVARGRTVGMLSIYADTPWTQTQFDTAQDIASRAALAIDNSLAYERIRVAQGEAEAARLDAEAATARLALLARVSDALGGDVEPDTAVARLAHLVVPQLADWSLVTVVDEEHGLRDIGYAHRDPEREREVAAYAARRVATTTDAAPLALAMRTGEPVLLEHLDDDLLAAAQPDPTMLQLVRGLDPHGLAIIPLTARGRVFGALTLITTHRRGSHTEDEIFTALEVARRAGPVLHGGRAAHRARRLAESLQRSVLAVPPAGPGLRIATRYRPAQIDQEVGGDWYDHFDLPDGATVVTIGDVVGHDTAAIAAMAQLRTFMRATAWTGRHSPAEVLRDTDSASRTLGPGSFATALTGELERARPDGTVVLRGSNAGHLPPLLRAPDGTVRYLRPGAPDVPLGVLDAAARHDHTVRVEPGSVLLLYTDGLVERRSRGLDEGLTELAEIVAAVPGQDLELLLDTVLESLGRGEAHSDDIAMIAVRTDDVGAPDSAVIDDDAVVLVADAAAAATARERVEQAVRDLPADLGSDAALLVSELVTNAVRHGAPPITLLVRRLDGGVRGSVGDSSPRLPMRAVRPPSPGRTGRGLIIIDALATEWGVTPGPAGKHVWFTLLVNGPPDRPR